MKLAALLLCLTLSSACTLGQARTLAITGAVADVTTTAIGIRGGAAREVNPLGLGGGVLVKALTFALVEWYASLGPEQARNATAIYQVLGGGQIAAAGWNSYQIARQP